jgi:hypothetical protein
MDGISVDLAEAYQMAELYATCRYYYSAVPEWLRAWLCKTRTRLQPPRDACELLSSFLNVAAAENHEALRWLVLVGGLTPRGSTLTSARRNDASASWLKDRGCPRWPSMRQRVRTESFGEGHLMGTDRAQGIVRLLDGEISILPMDSLAHA